MPSIPRPSRSAATASLVALALGLAAPAAHAKHGGDDRGGSGRGGGESRTRSSAGCGRAARADLDLRGRDGSMRFRYELQRGRAGESWRVVVVQEGRVVWRGTRRISRSGRFEVRLTLRDLQGADRVDVRAGGPRGTSCAIGATLRD
ncbi:hypothetical protein [Patulibacter minatonensis]|uniref:hypothetical protein n=1 Tax=Patulibacter minatonensis TaxID=298163 RepID=UPI00047E0A04|nr:hypothetical protein [Patulibacter minatonensis]